jgi:hypothetical protein
MAAMHPELITGGNMAKDTSFLTTYRCIRMRCALTVRLFDPIERCPRCRAMMTVIEHPALDRDWLVSEALADVLAGFDRLLQGHAA